jgi:glucose/arabinose dehydrogenase
VPEVAFGGQGGLGDVILHPSFAGNQIIYLSYAEPGEGGQQRGRGGASPTGTQ